MLFVARNFWKAYEESWPEFFLFLGVVFCGLSGLVVALRMIAGLGSGPEVPLTVIAVAYLVRVHSITLKDMARAKSDETR